MQPLCSAQAQKQSEVRAGGGSVLTPSTFVPLGDQWLQCTNPNTRRQTQTQGAENRRYEHITACPDRDLNIWHRHLEMQKEAPTPVTKAAHGRLVCLGDHPGLQSPFSVLSTTRPAFGKSTSWQKPLLLVRCEGW